MTTNELTTATLICPKCAGSMRTYERNGITIDHCTECRGIFLDRGELERLIEAEDVHYGRSAESRARSDDRHADPTDSERRHRGGKHDAGKHGGYGEVPSRRRRGGFLGDLLDFG